MKKHCHDDERFSLYLHSTASAALHKIADVLRLNAGSDELFYVVVVQFLQLHTQTHARANMMRNATVLKWFFGDNFVIFRRRSKRMTFWNQ